MDPAYIQGMSDDSDIYPDECNHDPQGHLNYDPRKKTMAKKDESPKNEPEVVEAIQKGTGTALVAWKDRMTSVKAAAQEAEKPQGGFISFKGGRMSYGDEMIPGDKINAIIIDYRFENDLYLAPYQPGVVRSPDCFAIAAPAERHLLGPYKRDKETGEFILENGERVSDAEDPQGDSEGLCEACEWNEWGSAANLPGGKPDSRGKGCKTTRRLMIAAADDCTTPEKIAKASVMTMLPPATSVDNFQNCMNQITKVLDTAHFGAVVEISVRPHDKFLFQVHFKVLQQITNEDLLVALLNKYEKEAQREIVYPKNSEREGGGAPPKQSTKY